MCDQDTSTMIQQTYAEANKTFPEQDYLPNTYCASPKAHSGPIHPLSSTTFASSEHVFHPEPPSYQELMKEKRVMFRGVPHSYNATEGGGLISKRSRAYEEAEPDIPGATLKRFEEYL